MRIALCTKRDRNVTRAVARTLIGGVYIHIFGLCPTNEVNFISKETSRVEPEYMNIHPPPPPINVLATALNVTSFK